MGNDIHSPLQLPDPNLAAVGLPLRATTLEHLAGTLNYCHAEGHAGPVVMQSWPGNTCQRSGALVKVAEWTVPQLSTAHRFLQCHVRAWSVGSAGLVAFRSALTGDMISFAVPVAGGATFLDVGLLDIGDAGGEDVVEMWLDGAGGHVYVETVALSWHPGGARFDARAFSAGALWTRDGETINGTASLGVVHDDLLMLLNGKGSNLSITDQLAVSFGDANWSCGIDGDERVFFQHETTDFQIAAGDDNEGWTFLVAGTGLAGGAAPFRHTGTRTWPAGNVAGAMVFDKGGTTQSAPLYEGTFQDIPTTLVTRTGADCLETLDDAAHGLGTTWGLTDDGHVYWEVFHTAFATPADATPTWDNVALRDALGFTGAEVTTDVDPNRYRGVAVLVFPGALPSDPIGNFVGFGLRAARPDMPLPASRGHQLVAALGALFERRRVLFAWSGLLASDATPGTWSDEMVAHPHRAAVVLHTGAFEAGVVYHARVKARAHATEDRVVIVHAASLHHWPSSEHRVAVPAGAGDAWYDLDFALRVDPDDFGHERDPSWWLPNFPRPSVMVGFQPASLPDMPDTGESSAAILSATIWGP